MEVWRLKWHRCSFWTDSVTTRTGQPLLAETRSNSVSAMCSMGPKGKALVTWLPCVVLFVSRNIVVGRSQSSLRRGLQMPIVDTVEEHFGQLHYCLPFFGWQVTKLVLYKVIHTLKRKKGNLFTQLWNHTNSEHPHRQQHWWILSKGTDISLVTRISSFSLLESRNAKRASAVPQITANEKWQEREAVSCNSMPAASLTG